MPRRKPSIAEEVQDLMTWSGASRCTTGDANGFDTRRSNGHTRLTRANRRAMTLCMDCPVMIQCLKHAIKHHKTGAIWGGMTDEERAEWEFANQVQGALVA